MVKFCFINNQVVSEGWCDFCTHKKHHKVCICKILDKEHIRAMTLKQVIEEMKVEVREI